MSIASRGRVSRGCSCSKRCRTCSALTKHRRQRPDRPSGVNELDGGAEISQMTTEGTPEVGRSSELIVEIPPP